MYASMTKDEHCFKIKDICNKLLLVAESKRRMGEITSEQEKEIILLVKYSDTHYEMFMPIIYVTEFSVIEQICEPADNEKKASVLSVEYLCREIPRDYFEIVSMKEIVGFFDLYNRRNIYMLFYGHKNRSRKEEDNEANIRKNRK